MGMRLPNFHYSADPYDISAQIDLIGMPWLMIREDPSAAPISGSRAADHWRSTSLCGGPTIFGGSRQ
jgi:hypothetical protein